MTVSKRAGDLGGVDPERDRRVQQAGAVEVEAKAELERERVQLADLLEGPDPSAARVVGVLDPEQAGARRVDRRDAVRGAGLLGAVAAGNARKSARDNAGMDGRPAELGDEDVAVLLADQLVAELGVETDCDLVRHRRGRQEDRLLLPEQARTALLELVDRGSSRRCSSPTAAAAIAARMPAVGRVAVSERRSITARRLARLLRAKSV